jgi:hypothetical protein
LRHRRKKKDLTDVRSRSIYERSEWLKHVDDLKKALCRLRGEENVRVALESVAEKDGNKV